MARGFRSPVTLVADGSERGGRFLRLVPLLAWVVAVMVVSSLALLFGQFSLHSAENNRLAERRNLAEQSAQFGSTSSDPQQTRTSLATTPFTRENASLILSYLLITPSGEPVILSELLDLSGSPIAVFPVGGGIQVADLGPAWDAAKGGVAGVSPVFRLNGVPRRATVIPIGTGVPWAVAVVVPDAASEQRFAEGLFGAGASGGLADVDPRGVALFAWDPALRGRRLVDPARLAGIRQAGTSSWTTGTGGNQVTTIAARERSTGYFSIFQQPTAVLNADLISQQRRVDLRLLAVLGVAFLAILAFGAQRIASISRIRARTDALLLNSRDVILVVDDDGAMIFVSSALGGLLGYPPSDWRGRPLTDFGDPADAPRIAVLLTGGGASGPLRDVPLRTADGELRWFDLEASDLRQNPDIAGVLVTCHEVSARKGLQDQLTYEASHDTLTGLPNRTVFATRLEATLEDAGRTGRPVSVLMVDLDLFKPINDTQGHQIGDQVLEIVAGRLASSIRTGDLVARYGGDEFAALLPDTDDGTANQIAERIRSAVREPITIGRLVLRIEASVGTATSTAEGIHPSRLIRAADQAMYRVKKGARNRPEALTPGVTVLAGTLPSTTGTPSTHLSSTLTPSTLTPSTVPSGTVPSSTVPSGTVPSGVVRPRPQRSPTEVAGPPRGARRSQARSGRRLRSDTLSRIWGGRWTPLLVVATILLCVAAVGSLVVVSAQTTNEHRRLDDRTAQVARITERGGLVNSTGSFIPVVNSAPWSLTDLALDLIIAQQFAAGPMIGNNAVIILYTPDGRILARTPADATTPIRPDSATWRAALSGAGGTLPVTWSDGAWRAFYALPILKAGRPMAVLVIGSDLKGTLTQATIAAYGTLGAGPGGLSVVDLTGRVLVSWDPALIGYQLVPAADLPSSSGVKRIFPAGHGDEVTLVERIPGPNTVGYTVFQQRTSVLYQDLRSGSLFRDLALFLIISWTIGTSAMLGSWRERNTRLAGRRLAALLNNAHDIIVVLDDQYRTTYVSSAIRGLLGYEPSTFLGKDITQLAHPDDRARNTSFTADIITAGHATARDVRMRGATGEYRWFDLDATDLRSNRHIRGFLVACHETGERKQLSEELAYRAGHDPLTGLANRAAFVQRLDEMADGAKEEGGGTFAVLFVDLDNFKSVNDTYGHPVGDDVLRVVGTRLKEAGRGLDLVCRLGGDEFVVVLRDVDVTDARRVAGRLLSLIREPIIVGDVPLRISATIGVALASSDVTQPDRVVRDADRAMYEGKSSGRGRFVVVGET